MLKFTRILIQNTKNTSNFRLHYSTASNLEFKKASLDNGISNNINEINKSSKELKPRNNMVAAVFASLQNQNQNVIQTPHTDGLLTSASTINELLSVSEGVSVSRAHALKVISILADWSLKGKINLPDFETDPRFIKLCKILTKTNAKHVRNAGRSDDLSTILSITADDEAAKLVASITVPQMVKVISTLTQKKRRSMILLRALSFNITRSSDLLDLKQCGDILYSMAVLNFPDENLLRRVCMDACKGINDSLGRSSVLGSILTSLGLLRYKDNDILGVSCQWFMKHADHCRSQDLFALFLTMAVLNYEPQNPENLFENLLKHLNIGDASKPVVWLDLVWSLVLLNGATTELISTVLSAEFIDSVTVDNGQSIAAKLKLLNIDSTVQYLIPNYTGPRLSASSEARNVELIRSKEKEEMCFSLIESLKNLMSYNYINPKVNTQMGFYIDAECYFDGKCNPILPKNFNNLPEQRKVAILILDYHDMCKGTTEPTGVNTLAIKLLEAQGYCVLTVPYTEYRPRDKLVERVRYLEAKLKTIVQL